MMKRPVHKLMFASVFALFFCALFAFAFAGKVYANGNTSADVPAEPVIKKTVRRAPVRRAPRKAPAKSVKKQEFLPPPEPPQPTSLEIGIMMVEQGRYEHARLWLQKAVQEESYNPYAWYWYGVAHDKVGQYNQAQFFYARALAIDPAFPPFSRVVAYPDEGDRKALWDPLRPARVYPVEAGVQGVAIVPPDAPEATARPLMPYVDPTLPDVPVYVPPQAPSLPGDAIQPPVYVPPSISGGPVYAEPPHVEAEVSPMEPVPTPEYIPAAPQPPVYAPPPPQQQQPGNTAGGPVYTPPPPQQQQPGSAAGGPVYTPPPPQQQQPGNSTGGPVYTPPPPQQQQPGNATGGPVYTPPPPR